MQPDIQPDENSTPIIDAPPLEIIVDASTFYLIGLRLNGRGDHPDFYTFLIEQNGQILPLVFNGQVILFADVKLAQSALNAANIQVEFRELSDKNTYLRDVSQTLYLLESQSADEQHIIANLLDLFAIILNALAVPVPPFFADALIAFSKHVDQNPFYGDFIEQKTITRHRMIDATRWCLGTIFSLARIITSESGE